MIIAIDFDGTWTLDPILWRKFYFLFAEDAHHVIMATGRKAWSDDMARALIPPGMPIYYTDREPKEAALLRQGVKVDVWIDDMPGMIQECRIIGTTNNEEL